MMNNETLCQLQERKSVRVYDPARPIAPEVKQALLEAAIAAPTAGCMSLYTILDITDPAIKAELAELCDHQPFIATAPVLLVFLADWQRWYDSFVAVTQGVTRTPAEGDLALALSDANIAAQNTVVAAHALGLGSCYIGDVLEHQEKIAHLLHLPRYTMPATMLCIGYPTAQQLERTKPQRFPLHHLVHENVYRLADEKELRAMHESRMPGNRDGFEKTVLAMAKRKWDSEFMHEMSRSVKSWFSRWTGKP